MMKIKALFTLALVIIGMVSWAQEELLLKRKYEIDNGDTTNRYDYDYDENNQLKTVIWFNSQGDTSHLWHYENDTIRYYTSAGGAYKPYVYTEDSIIQYNYDQSQALVIYYLDEQNHVIHYYLRNVTPSDFYQEFTGDNITKQWWVLYGDTTEYSATYSDYLNPAYPANRIIQKDIDCSYHMIHKTFGDSGNEIFDYDVVESIGNYPVRINVYKNNGLDHELCFEYLSLTSTPEISRISGEILSVNYFDLLGRIIEKPDKGFYIEVKATGKRIQAQKHFIP